jgi:aconitate hydratase
MRGISLKGSTMAVQDFFNAKDTFDTGSGEAVLYRLDALQKQGVADIDRLPFLDQGAT